ncbi:solute:sodium symporter family transporter [Entomospira entomophila]|uniref:Solute:sodium symporter family transporter n=1 Tax=Entomospira entomophila TaxID=2719988 RepID=A0A968GB91_9SPIO|nr:solute:sodium symporter family transporter [Entomospira entomophilus]NIZ40211.1 solute:sodium symporter family transporter [Entomospira entomophilus]WDI35770.1 solute:sodium symporter family transporter [Entomospira entomophilus]
MGQFIFIFSTFLFFTILVGVISAILVKNGDNQKTAKGYFLAGYGLSGLYIAGSLLITNISAESLVGLAGQSYGANMSGMAWEATAVISTIIMAFVFLPLYLRKGYTTLPEFMEDRYGKSVRRMVSILFLVGYLLVGIPVSLYAGAVAFNQVFRLDEILGFSTELTLTILIVVVGIVGALYAVVGGLKAVAISDTINGILLVAGSFLVIFFGFLAVGKMHGGGFFTGLHEVLHTNPEKLNAIGGAKDPVPFAGIFTGILLANLFYWGTNQMLIQRTLGAKNLKEGQKGVLLSGFLKMLIPFFVIIPGIIAAHLLPDLAYKDFAYPSLIAATMPWPLAGLFAAALFGAVYTTYNSFLNSASTIFMVDIYKPIINPNLSDEKTVKIAKQVGWLFALFSIVFSPFLNVLSTGLYDFGRSFTGFYNIPIITLVLIGIFSKRGSTPGAILATVFHILFYSGFKFWFKHIDTPLTNAIVEISYIHIYGISFIVMVMIIWIASYFHHNQQVFDKSSQADPSYDMTPWRHKNAVAIWLISFLVYEYFLFSPMGLATTQRNDTRITIISIIMVVFTILLVINERRKVLQYKQNPNKEPVK